MNIKIGNKTRVKFVKDRPGHDFRYALDNKKMFKEFRWKPKIKFEEGLKETINWYFKHRKFLKNISKEKYEKRLGLNDMIKKGIILAGGMGTRMSPLN